jgi:hypothetical protein
MVAELWGVWEGLQHAWRLGFHCVEHRIDFMQVVNMLHDKKGVCSVGWSIFQKIKILIQLEWDVHILSYLS